jgi:transcriptional regulator with XRE-family HTH domain
MEPKAERKGLGQVIRALRELEGMSRDDLAERSKLGVDMIAKVEQGAKSPSAGALNRIAEALGVDPVELSNRGLAWAKMLDSPDASNALLRAISTSSGVAYSALRAGRVAVPRGAAALPAGLAIGAAGAAGAAGFAYLADKKVRKDAEDALRKLLEQRLKDASTPEDLAQLAEALETPLPGEMAPPPEAQ